MKIREPRGVSEVLIVASGTPLRKSRIAMQDFASKEGQDRGPVTLTDPIELVGDLLDDLNESTRSSRSIAVERDEVRRIDTTQLATMSITFEVI